MSVQPVPPGFHTVTPYLIVDDAHALRRFLKEGLGAEEIHVMETPEGTIRHGMSRIGDSFVMFANATEEWKAMPATLQLYVEDVDRWHARALAAGATNLRDVADQFYGDRTGGVLDPCGNGWWFATRIEEVSEEEMQRRLAAMSQQQ